MAASARLFEPGPTSLQHHNLNYARHHQPVRPRFSLGGQVSSHHAASASNLATADLDAADHVLSAGARHFSSHVNLFSGSSGVANRRRHSLLADAVMNSMDPGGGGGSGSSSKSLLSPEQLLLDEFTRDEQSTTASPSSMFKSSFAKEVVQNVRRSASTSINNVGVDGRPSISSKRQVS